MTATGWMPTTHRNRTAVPCLYSVRCRMNTVLLLYLKTFVQQRFHFILVCSKGRGIVQQNVLVITSAFFRCTPYASLNLEHIDDKFTMPFPTNVSPYLSVSYVKYLIRRVLCLRWNRMSCIVRICTHKPTPLLLSPRKVVAWSYRQASSCEKTLPHKNVHKNASLTIIRTFPWRSPVRTCEHVSLQSSSAVTADTIGELCSSGDHGIGCHTAL